MTNGGSLVRRQGLRGVAARLALLAVLAALLDTGVANAAEPAAGTDAAASNTEAAATVLRNRLAAAQQANADQQRRIEQARQQALADIAQLQADLRERDATLAAVRQRSAALPANAAVNTSIPPLAHAGIARQLADAGLTNDPLLTPKSLLARWPQVADALEQRLADLDASLAAGLSTREVHDRSGRPVRVPVWRWGAVQQIAMGTEPAQRGLLRRLDDGHWQIAGPTLKTFAPGQQPIDIGNQLALHAADANAGSLIAEAGPFAWPILLLAALGAWLVGERLWLLYRWRQAPEAVERLLAQPLLAASAAPQAPSLRVVSRILASSQQPPDARQQLAGAALIDAEVQIQRGLRLLAAIAATAPLLGLLGTVTGMISSFNALDLGADGSSDALSGGIGEALLTTELGLLVAVPLLIAHALFARDAQRRRAATEAAAMRALAALDHPDPAGVSDA